MKIRIGFVSNSSSSSYLLLTSKECHDGVTAKMTERERLALKIFGQFEEEGTLFGVPIVILSYMSGNYGDYLYYQIREDEQWDAFSEAAEDDPMDEIWETVAKYEEKVRKNKENCFTSSNDF